MGYDIHVHRRTDWLEEGDDITLEDWKTLIAKDESLHIDGAVFWSPGNGEPSIETPTAEWTGAGSGKGYFYWYAGTICAKNLSQAAITKLYEMAQLFNARVQGDDFEYYGPDGSALQ